MRIGSNPTKENNKLDAKYYHRIIMPVYVPNLEGYFSNAKEVLQLCLDSLITTIHEKAAITVINNACCKEIEGFLQSYYDRKLLDQLIVNKENNGKIDPLISAARGTYEPLITITDSDVLFLPGWITEVERAIEAFPRIGLVSPCPIPSLWSYHNSATIFSNLFQIRQAKLISDEELMYFPKSVGKPGMYDSLPNLMAYQSYIEKKGVKVLIGAGHFVATMRKEVFDYAPKNPSLKKIVGGSERNYIDIPVDKGGFYRVALSRVMAHHIGNIPEKWMEDMLGHFSDTPRPAPFFDSVPKCKRNKLISLLPPSYRQKIVQLLLYTRIFKLIGFRNY